MGAARSAVCCEAVRNDEKCCERRNEQGSSDQPDIVIDDQWGDEMQMKPPIEISYSSAVRFPLADETSEPKMGEKFVVMVEKNDGQKLGFGLTELGDTVIVNEISPEGAIIRYNMEHPTRKVQLEDIIDSVNGSSSKLQDIRDVVKEASGILTMVMERPKIWHAALKIPAGGNSGIQLGEAQKACIPILSVDEKGTVATFNAANPGNEIAAGDFIIRTAGLKKDGPKMLEYIRKKHEEAQEGPCTIDCTVWRNLSG